jgi:2-methylcitrate dehydratase PrpD
VLLPSQKKAPKSVLTERLAEFVASQSAKDIPDEVYDAARDAVIDTLGVALAGSREEVADIAAAWIGEIGAQASATVWGRKLSSHVSEAAFVNGISAHALDFDDSFPSGRGHISACLVPTVLTVGEVSGASGQDVLAAYIIGSETASILGRVFGPGHQRRGWHPTATVGTLASTAAAGRLLGLDAKNMACAWGIAGSQVGGLARNFGTMTKPFHIGRAAQAGVVSANLAAKGFTADGAIFDDAGGVMDVYVGGDGEPVEEVISSLAEPWSILSPGNYVKQWPCCFSGHRTIGALFDLINQQGINRADVTDVSIEFLPGGDASLLSRNPQTGLEGKFSIEYIVAAFLLDGVLRMSTFTDEMVQRAEARQLMQRVERIYIPDEKFYSGIAGYNDITVTTKDGEFKVHEDRVPGSRVWPMSEADRDTKFMDCASQILDDSSAADLLKRIKNIRAADDIQAMVRATVPY